MNILVVDDNQTAADLLCELLELQDHDVHCAYTAKSALELFRQKPYHAALIDLTLPDLPGTELVGRLRTLTDGSSAKTLMVAITGFSASDAGDPSIFDHFLQKPIDFDELDAILVRHAQTQ